MSWDSFNHVDDIITLVILLYGLWGGFWEVHSRRATQHLGPICQNKDDVGYFVAKIPWKWFNRWLFPFWVPKVQVPRLPTVSSIIKAGDAGLFTSGMVNGIPSRYFRVSWRPIYEAFFQEYAWAADQYHDFEPPQVGPLGRYRKKAEYDVWKAKRDAEEKSSGCVIYWMHKHLLSLSDNEHVICISSRTVSHLNPHLYYYPWRLGQETSGEAPEIPGQPLNGTLLQPKQKKPNHSVLVGPILVKSLRLFHNDNYPRHSRNGVVYQKAWIHEQRPAVEVSEEELAALSFFLGLELKTKKDEFLPMGQGGFGFTLTSNSYRGISSLRLIHGSQSSFGGSVGCSGYSTLFAKHLACGCIPFAHDQDNGATQTLAVTPKVCTLILTGKPICNKSTKPRDWYHPAGNCLQRMPHLGVIDYYASSIPLGTNCKIDEPPLMAGTGELIDWQKGKKSGTWWEAVAGIAFGGLVPMATENVVRMVGFSVGWGSTSANRNQVDVKLTGNDIKSFYRIMKFIMKHIWQRPELKDFTLFGEGRLECLRTLDEKNSLEYDFNGWVESLPNMPIGDIVAFLGLYTTLLEALIALVEVDHPDTQDTFDIGRSKRDAAFKACQMEIATTYLKAVEPSCFSEDDKCISTLLTPIISRLSHEPKISDDQCGTVARCIIMLWTHLVRVIDWEQSSTEERYRPLSLEDLPDVAAWE